MMESLAGALSTTLNPAGIALRLAMAAAFGLDRERKVRRRTAGDGDRRPRDRYTPAAI